MLIDQRRIPRITPDAGNLYYYDVSRSKWLSTNRETFVFGLDQKNLSGIWQMSTSGDVVTASTGIPIQRNATIISLTCQVKQHFNPTTADFIIRKNNVGTDITKITLATGTDSNILDNLNIDISQGDFLQAVLDVIGGRVHYPLFNIEIAWRKT